jgi:hypothetical protein
VIDPDRERRPNPDRERRPNPDPRDASPGASSTGPRRLAAAVGVLVFVASVLPVPSAGASESPDGAAGVVDGAVGVVTETVGLVVGAVPAEVGLTAPFHVVGYAVLAALLVPATGRESRVVAVIAAVAAATAFGFGIELVQAPIPWRSFAWSDVALNVSGAVVGAVISAVAGPVIGTAVGTLAAREETR